MCSKWSERISSPENSEGTPLGMMELTYLNGSKSGILFKVPARIPNITGKYKI